MLTYLVYITRLIFITSLMDLLVLNTEVQDVTTHQNQKTQEEKTTKDKIHDNPTGNINANADYNTGQ